MNFTRYLIPVMNTTTHKHVNRRERIGGLIYVLLFFCAGVGLSAWLLLSDSSVSRIFARKDSVQLKMERQQSFRKAQENSANVCDLLVERILAYDPGVNATYEKNDIQYIINELRRQYDDSKNDKRYVAFLHTGDFYQMWFNDRQYLWSLGSNLSYLKSNLEECELGLQKRKEELKGNK